MDRWMGGWLDDWGVHGVLVFSLEGELGAGSRMRVMNWMKKLAFYNM